uniref:Uncharacterized protein n=1 Tax=Tanacetum cinerariifolium TaxID=118510 RepID=A0A6L2KUM7_TANCI|nr:hypothetical protein [Tanacetum cinerariifolium]
MGFKPTKQVYQPVSKKHISNNGVNKKKNMKPTKEVSKSNPFEVLISVENDVEFGTNGGTLNLASQATNSSVSLFWNVDASSPSTTPIMKKIDKIEKLIIDGKFTLLDDEESHSDDFGPSCFIRVLSYQLKYNSQHKPLENVASLCDYDSEDKVALVDNEMASFLAKKMAMVHRVWLSSGRNLTRMMCKIHVKYRSFHSIRAKSP